MTDKNIRTELFRIEILKRRKMKKFLLDIGLTPGQGQARILNFLSKSRPVTQKELSDECMLDVTTMSRTIDRLDRQGLTEKVRDPACRRACRISLTDRGRKMAETVNQGLEMMDDMLCSALDQEEQAVLAGLLKKVRMSLEQEERELGGED